VIQTDGAASFSRSVHAGNLGGSTSAYVSALLRPVSGQATLKLTSDVDNQQGWEAEINFFGLNQGGNNNRYETSLFSPNFNFLGQTASTPSDINFDGMEWIEAEIGYDGTTLTARWRDVDNTSGASLGNWNDVAFVSNPDPNTVFEYW